MLELQSKYPLRVLGYQDGDPIEVTEEQRPNIHIIGSARQGKSKFIEHLIIDDIERGLGCCLLDPTSGGQTAYDILKYCCVKKKNKVLFIDPHHRFDYKKIPGLQPFLYTADGRKSQMLKSYSIETIKDTVRALFNVKDPADTSRIERYMPAVLSVLYDSQSPLADARYFSKKIYVEQQKERLLEADSDSRYELEEAFKTNIAYSNFQSTINRLSRFYRNTLGMMFSVDKGINFMKLVAEGWVIIVNLESGAGFDFFDGRLLGTYIINEIQTAKERLIRIMRKRDPTNYEKKIKPFYVYADEAFMFASQKLTHMLDLMQKTNLKVTLAYHYAKQFDDPAVYNSILQNCDITVMFYTRSKTDRDQISEEFYGGDISPKEASYANSNLRKRYAVMKVGKRPPIRVRIPDVRIPPVSEKQLRNYISDIYQQPWYYEPKELKDQLDDYKTPPSSKPPRKGKVANKRTPVKTVFD